MKIIQNDTQLESETNNIIVRLLRRRSSRWTAKINFRFLNSKSLPSRDSSNFRDRQKFKIFTPGVISFDYPVFDSRTVHFRRSSCFSLLDRLFPALGTVHFQPRIHVPPGPGTGRSEWVRDRSGYKVFQSWSKPVLAFLNCSSPGMILDS